MKKSEITQRFDLLNSLLLSSLNKDGFWEGELSSSALATAVAVVALETDDPYQSREPVNRGINWLCENINQDGGFGDSPGSLSNVSATLLCYAAISRCAAGNDGIPALQYRMAEYLLGQGVDVKSTAVVDSILGYYGKDYTFSLPILAMLVVCNVLDRRALKKIPQLPFELTLLPSSIYRFFNLQVVSYAIPALVAVGIYLFQRKPGRNPFSAFVRTKASKPALVKLEKMMPESGGFLEAIPLTAFVSLCLVSSGYAKHRVVGCGLDFLRRVQRADGSWPIDTNLATWVTTLSIKAMGHRISTVMTEHHREQLLNHLLDHQYKTIHPFNQAKSGGWGWTSFSGSVPDADDTAGAILALLTLDPAGNTIKASVIQGCTWLGRLQNRDGGIPTFCRGWGRLPFDASCADLTAHALLAWVKTTETYSINTESFKKTSEIRRLKRHADLALGFLQRAQRSDGAWLPLWFGNQNTANKTNPVYGAARVMGYLNDAVTGNGLDHAMRLRTEKMIAMAAQYLLQQQNTDGSWGAEKGLAGSIEETALAVSALVRQEPSACMNGLNWLAREYENHGLSPTPIGLYFATLWYHERMYPLVHYLEALRKTMDVYLQDPHIQ